jgi:hypothetical protein
MLAELPSTKRQNLLVAEIDELLRRTFGTSDEDRNLKRALEEDTPLFRGRRVIGSEEGNPKGIAPVYRLSIAGATVRFLEKIPASVPEGVFDEVSTRARMLAEEEFANVYGDVTRN